MLLRVTMSCNLHDSAVRQSAYIHPTVGSLLLSVTPTPIPACHIGAPTTPRSRQRALTLQKSKRTLFAWQASSQSTMSSYSNVHDVSQLTPTPKNNSDSTVDVPGTTQGILYLIVGSSPTRSRAAVKAGRQGTPYAMTAAASPYTCGQLTVLGLLVFATLPWPAHPDSS
jgi:hypothetical protein